MFLGAGAVIQFQPGLMITRFPCMESKFLRMLTEDMAGEALGGILTNYLVAVDLLWSCFFISSLTFSSIKRESH